MQSALFQFRQLRSRYKTNAQKIVFQTLRHKQHTLDIQLKFLQPWASKNANVSIDLCLLHRDKIRHFNTICIKHERDICNSVCNVYFNSSLHVVPHCMADVREKLQHLANNSLVSHKADICLNKIVVVVVKFCLSVELHNFVWLSSWESNPVRSPQKPRFQRPPVQAVHHCSIMFIIYLTHLSMLSYFISIPSMIELTCNFL